MTLKIANDLVTFTPYSTFVIVSLINDPTRYAQLLRERKKSAITHTQSFVGEGFGRSTLSGENCGQTSSQQLDITVLVALGVIIPKYRTLI